MGINALLVPYVSLILSFDTSGMQLCGGCTLGDITEWGLAGGCMVLEQVWLASVGRLCASSLSAYLRLIH